MRTHKTRKTISNFTLIVLALAIGIFLGLWQIKAPPVNENSPSYQRMLSNIQKMAVEPHPAGSLEIGLVRAQLLAEIEGMGLSPIVEDEVYSADEMIEASMWVQNTTLEEWWAKNQDWVAKSYNIYSSDDFFVPRVGDDGTLLLQNILVKLDAPNPGGGVMFVSHYDSTSGGPGAVDDMVAVCSMLEVMREQSQNPAVKNDLYFLFTDGEEDALLGAWRFVSNHPELKSKIDMVVNLEARGNRGGLLLFETSPKAFPLLKIAVKSGSKPIGFSWLAAVYAMMPNTTDMSAFLKGGYTGINFAVAEGVETYHQPTDSYENLNHATAWQYLNTTTALADYAANNALGDLHASAKDAVYFSLLPGFMVLIDYGTSYVLCAAACILALIYRIAQLKPKLLKASIGTIFMGVLTLLSILSAIFFVPGNYLFYIPLFAMTLTAFFKKWPVAHGIVRFVSIILVLLLWVPVVFLLWISMVQPMIV